MGDNDTPEVSVMDCYQSFLLKCSNDKTLQGNIANHITREENLNE
jgi:hypothetical protein